MTQTEQILIILAWMAIWFELWGVYDAYSWLIAEILEAPNLGKIALDQPGERRRRGKNFLELII